MHNNQQKTHNSEHMFECSCEPLGRSHKPNKRSFSVLLALLLAFALAFGLSSCKPTDFFTEVVITPYSDVVDTNNPTKDVINSPDAQTESDSLSALDWTDDSKQTSEVNKVVVYGSTPNTNKETHHSVFDLSPRFVGVESSDPVRLVFKENATLDNKNAGANTQQQQQRNSTSAGSQNRQQNSQSTPTQDQSDSQSSSSDGAQTDNSQGGAGTDTSSNTGADAGNNAGGTTGGDTSGGGEGDNGDNGKTDEKYAGYGGSVREYNPGDAFTQTPRAESIAVIGDDVAVLAQAIGGRGAINATTRTAFSGDSGRDHTVSSTFKEVFSATGDIDATDFEANKILWENTKTGSTTAGSRSSNPSGAVASGDLSDIQKLVQACGQNGVII